MNEISDNFFDVLNELKTADKTNAGGETVNSESRDRPSIDNMTERQYNNFGWVTVNNVMSYEEYGSLMHQFDDFKNRKHSYPTTENGEALIIAYDNEHNATKLAGIKGTTANPVVTMVIDINRSLVPYYLTEFYLEGIRENGRYFENIAACQAVEEKQLFTVNTYEDFPSYSELKKQRRSSGKGRKNSESFLYGSGSGGENSETGYVSNEPSSTDGGFSMPDNQNYSTKRNTNDMRFHNLRYIEKAAEVSADANVEQSYKDGSATSATDYNVANLYDFVKRNDKEFTPGKSVNKSFLNSDGTPKVFYHGTPNGTFTEFRDWQYFNGTVEAYRGTKIAKNGDRRADYFLLISTVKDNEGNEINVPIHISKHGQVNKAIIDINRVSTVFARDKFTEYLKRELKAGNIVKIKNRSTQASESTELIPARYNLNASIVNDNTTPYSESQDFSEKRDRYEAKQRYVDRRNA